MAQQQSSNRWVILVVALAVVVGAYFALRSGPGDDTSRGNLTVAYSVWSTGPPPQWTARLLLEELGYNVEFQEADVGVIFAGVARGDMDIFVDAWPTLHQTYLAQYGDQLVPAGVVYGDVVLGWAAPAYADFDSVEDLRDPAVAASLDTNGDGRGEIHGIDPGAGMMETTREIIQAYDLDYELVASSEPAMLVELDRAINENRPIVIIAWEPHWKFTAYDLKFLDEPQQIWSPPEETVVTPYVRAGLPEEEPVAMELLRQMEFTVDEMNGFIHAIAQENREPQEVMQEWIDANRDQVDQWLAAARAAG